jgi:hypothetical protein
MSAVLFLLTSIATASAECAWVLWGFTIDKSARMADYSAEEAHATQRECDQGVRDFAPALRGQGYSVSGGAAGSRMVLGKKEGTSVKYFCLPDTVDPRGPKGAGQ